MRLRTLFFCANFAGKKVITALLSLVVTHSAVADVALDRSLVSTAKQGDLGKLKQLLQQGADPTYVELSPAYGEGVGYSALYNAVSAQSLDCVKILLDAGADPLKGHDREPSIFPLALAFRSGTNKAIIELLLNVIKEFPHEDRFTDFVVYPAATRNDISTLKRLEKLGIRLGSVSKSGKTAFIAVAETGRFVQAEQWLNDYSDQYRQATNKIDIHLVVETLASHPFSEAQFVRVVARAREYGLEFFDSQNTHAWTRAAAYRLLECAKVLGCPPDEQRKIVPRSPEQLALVATCNIDTLPIFTNLLHNVLSSATDHKATASRLLFELLRDKIAYWRLQVPALEYLVSQGANVSYEEIVSTNTIRTPLEAAIVRSDLSLVKWVAEHGADINYVTSKQMTPLHWAVVYGNPGILNWLLEHGARVQEQKTGRPLLTQAVTGDFRDALIPILLKAGADPYMRGPSGKSAIDILADRRDILRLREIDTKRQYGGLVRQYSPPADSPFIGVWWNEEDEFKTFSLILNDEGMAIVGTSIMPLGPFPWRTTDASRAIIELVEKDKREEIVVQFVVNENALRVSSPSAPTTRLLKKQPEKPLKISEYRKQMGGK